LIRLGGEGSIQLLDEDISKSVLLLENSKDVCGMT
jgi:hypothetical protein